ncbi:MAG: hypothetical protein ACJ768_00390 [Gaiellaceae bacterium]
MNRRRFAVLAVVLVTVNVFFWLAGSGFALSSGGGLLQTLLGGRMIRAEVVWQAPDGSVRDSQLYRGVITAISSGSITLREKDRPADVIPVATDAVVRNGAQVETTSALKRGMRVLVERPANAPADTIQIEGYGG